jgi:predicted amidohydrolase YtcJ
MIRYLAALLAISILSGADLVLRNGKIVTMDPAKPLASALAISGGQIRAVGTDGEMAAEITPATKVIDLRGRLAIPGFIEAHGHFMGLGESKMMLDLRGARNWDEIAGMVAAAAREAKPGEWIRGGGWNQEKWDRKPQPEILGFPLEESLSRVSPNNPVQLIHASGHAVFANKAALTRAGISRVTADPPGGEILRDTKGEPTGLLNEKAQLLVADALSRDVKGRTPAEREAQAQRAIDLAAADAVAKGVTTFHDAGSPPDVVQRLKARAEKGTLPIRLYMMLRTSNAELFQAAPRLRTIGYGGNFLTVRAIKRMIDGALGSRGAWLLEPYSDLPSSGGINTEDLKDIEATANFAIRNGFQLAVHAIGDRGNREVLDLYERIFRANPAATGLRWRIEHAQHLNPADISRFAKLGVIASMQGVHATSDARMVVPRLGPKRAEGAYAWRSLLDVGAHIANGTDAPVEDIDPIASFYASITRRTPSGETFYPAQRMTRMEALRSYTVEGAYAGFEENLKGSLKPGMLGDVAVLSHDILTVAESEISKTRVDYTIIGGKIVWERK